MLHLDATLRPEHCDDSQCSSEHYSSLKEARQNSDKHIVNAVANRQENYRKFDSELNSITLALQTNVSKLKTSANLLGFFVRDYQFKKDVETFYESLAHKPAPEGKEVEVESFKKLYIELQQLHRASEEKEIKYFGWARYYRYPKSKIIHYRENCRKLVFNSYRRDIYSLIEANLSGKPYQELLASDLPICGFCFPHVRREIKTQIKSDVRCPNSGSIRFESLTSPVNFSINLGSCDECKGEISVTKTGKLRAHSYPLSEANKDLLKLKLKGENDKFTWTIETSNNNNILTIQSKDNRYIEHLSKRVLNNILQHSDHFESFIEVYGSIITSNIDFQIGLSSFYKFEVIKLNVLQEIVKENNAFIKAELLFFARKYPNEEVESIRRLVYVKHYPELAYDGLGHNGVYAIDANKRATLDECLDFLDFLHNGKSDESYKAFRSENAGRMYAMSDNGKQSFSFGRDINFSLRTLYLSAHRYHQMVGRSQKLKKVLNNLTLRELLSALDSEIPGWLLVNDTIALIESAKNDRGLGKGFIGRGTWKNYQAQEIYREYGEELAKEIDALGRVEDFLKYVYSEKFIEEARWINKKSFVIHAINALGIEEFLHIMAIVYHESEGITARGFNRLISQGGFLNDDTPEAWQVLLVNW